MSLTRKLLNELEAFFNVDDSITLDGNSLCISHVLAAAETPGINFKCAEHVEDLLNKNAAFLAEKIAKGCVIYGVNTGYGGSADVRSDDIPQLQRSLVHHLNGGFGETLQPSLVRAVMAVRANSLSKGYSGVRPAVIHSLLHMLNNNIIPVVPKRGSVSASGDLMPTSYIASCMMGRPGARVMYQGAETTVSEVLKLEALRPIEFQAKEALAVVNATSFASSLGACILYDASYLMLLTQVATALSVECLRGRVESYHPTLHKTCLPHVGQIEAAANLCHILKGSTLAVQTLDVELQDCAGLLKQDRYALRTAAQWLSPAIETISKAIDTLTIDINSANDNPIINHRSDEILHGGNFQGTSCTVAMDQTRQALQLCGKLLFAQMSEMLNVMMSNGLPPNLCGSNPNTDFGLKGMDTAMASYMSELDYLTGPLTNHVLSAEMHNQSVNSLGLISARMTQQALELLQMMIANITLAHVQALDLRWLQHQVEQQIKDFITKYGIKEKYVTSDKFPWYKFAFQPQETATALMEHVEVNGKKGGQFMKDLQAFVTPLVQSLCDGQRISNVAASLGQGTRQVYLFIRQDLKVPFCDGVRYLDTMLETLHMAIKQRKHLKLVLEIFKQIPQCQGHFD